MKSLSDYQLDAEKCLANFGEANSYCLSFKSAMEAGKTEMEIESEICVSCIFYSKGQK